MFKKLLVAAMLIASTKSIAGQDGNGGFGLNCNGKIEVLDLYEAKEKYNYNINLGPTNLSVDQKVEIMLQRMARISPTMADRFRLKYKDLWNKAEILRGKTIINNNDVLVGANVNYKLDIGETIIPDTCDIIPLARNLVSEELEKNIYFLGRYWDHLDNNNKAALMLHEMIYFHLIKSNVPTSNSSRVRKLISLLASNEASVMSYEELIKKYLDLNIKFIAVDVNGYPSVINREHLEMNSDGSRIKQAFVTETYPDKNNTILNYGLNKFTEDGMPLKFGSSKSNFIVNGETYESTDGYYKNIEIFGNGTIKKIFSDYQYAMITSKNTDRIFSQKEFRGRFGNIDGIRFSADGKVQCLHFRYNSSDTKVKINGKWQLVQWQLQLDSSEKPLSLECKVDD